MKAKLLLTSVIAGLALFAASAGIASADDPHDNDHGCQHCDHDHDNDRHHGDHDKDRHDDHKFTVSYCWNILTCDFNQHASLIIVFVWVPQGFFAPHMAVPGGFVQPLPPHMMAGYPGFFGYPGMGY